MLITGHDSVSLNVYPHRNGKRRGELEGKRLLQPHRDHLGDAGVFHGDAVEGVGHSHGGLGVGDEDELRDSGDRILNSGDLTLVPSPSKLIYTRPTRITTPPATVWQRILLHKLSIYSHLIDSATAVAIIS